MSILRRYVLRELIGPVFLSVCFFTFLMLLRALFRHAELLIEAGVSILQLAEFLGIIALTLLIITIPMAALMGCLIGIGRLTSENEILAIRVAGISLPRVFLPVFAAAALGSAILMWVGFTTLPNVLKSVEQRTDSLRFEILTNLEPGWNYTLPDSGGSEISLVFESREPLQPDDGPYTLRMNQVALRVEGGTNQILGTRVTIRRDQPGAEEEETEEPEELEEPEGPQLRYRREVNATAIFAQRGSVRVDVNTRSVHLELEDGVIFPVSFAELTYDNDETERVREGMESENRIAFKTLHRELEPRTEADRPYRQDPRQFTLAELRDIVSETPREWDGSPMPMYRMEDGGRMPRAWMFWLSCRNEYFMRFALPWSLLAFVLIAVPLAVELRPRAKSLAFIISIALLLLYYVMVTAAGALGMTNSPLTLPAYMAPNVLIGGIGIVLFWRSQR